MFVKYFVKVHVRFQVFFQATLLVWFLTPAFPYIYLTEFAGRKQARKKNIDVIYSVRVEGGMRVEP